jgi:hypothetical protein
VETVRVCDSVAGVVTVVVLRKGQAVSDTTHLRGQLMSVDSKCMNADSSDTAKAFSLISDLVYCIGVVADQLDAERPEIKPVALDVSLEKARALHRVWRALNDGDCPKCHTYRAASEMLRGHEFLSDAPAIWCPNCNFGVTHEEIKAIEKMFAPAMDAAVAIFEQWRAGRHEPAN